MTDKRFQRIIKRAFDILIAATVLLAGAPALVGVALLILWKMGVPVLFRQQRPGLHGRLFTMYKFRTMNDDRNANGELKSDAERLTDVGRFLRYFSLDEIPQLWNVLRGEMSLVGPRPLLREYLPLYTPEQARRHEVLPGITGLAQVNGRQDIPFSVRLSLDVWYVAHWSLVLDFRILLHTLACVLPGKGVRLGQDVAEVDDLGFSFSQGSKPVSTSRIST